MSQTATLRSDITAPTTVPGLAALPLAGRIAIAAIFLLSGLNKLAAPVSTIAYIQASGLPFPPLTFGISAAVEVLGGIALILGFRTRTTAAIMTLFTLAAALSFHTNFTDQNQFIHFWKNIAMAGGLLQVIAFGAGRYSLDNRR
jgi:putative oxidoreductase